MTRLELAALALLGAGLLGLLIGPALYHRLGCPLCLAMRSVRG